MLLCSINLCSFLGGCNVSEFKRKITRVRMLVVTWMWASVNIPWTGCLEWGHFLACKWYLNTPHFQKGKQLNKTLIGRCSASPIGVHSMSKTREVRDAMNSGSALRVCPPNFRSSGQMGHPWLWGQEWTEPSSQGWLSLILELWGLGE